MQDSITEILRLVADRVIRPEEGQDLLEALRIGYPEDFDRPGAAGHPGQARTPPRSDTLRDTDDRRARGARACSSGSSGSTEAAEPSPGASPKQPDPVSTDSAGPHLHPGDAIEIPSVVLLRIEPSGLSRVADAPLSSVSIRGVTGHKVRVVRGSGVELHKEEETAWRLTWPGGMLFLEVPVRLAGLEIHGIPGSVGLSGYAGPFAGEEIGGGFTVHGAAAPFRIREVQGTVQLLRLALRDGISTIAAVAQDVDIETAGDASVTIRASLRAEAPEGAMDLSAEDEVDADRGGRRGVWRVGAGTAQLNVSQIRGQLRLHPAEDVERGSP